MAINITSSINLTQFEDTSTTSHSMPTSTAAKAFTVSAGKSFVNGDTCQATATAAVIPTGIYGTQTYSGTTLTLTPNNSLPANAILCGIYGEIYSKSSVATGTGSKTFGISAEPSVMAALTFGLAVKVYSRAAPFTNFMSGTVASLTNGSLVVTVATATGSATIADWIICQDGTFTAWDISPQAADNLTATGAPVITISQTPKTPHKFVTATTNGKLLLKNTSTSTMLYYRLFEAGGANSGSEHRFEQNGIWAIEGDWISLGTGTGVANQTLSLPAGYPELPVGIEVETASSSGVFEEWIILPKTYHKNSGFPLGIIAKTYPIATNPIGKILWHDGSTDTVECGDGTNGAVIPSGAIVRLPNILVTVKEYAPFVVQTAPVDTTSTTSVLFGSSSSPAGTSQTISANTFVFTAGHGLVVGSTVVCTATTVTGLSVNTVYYVLTVSTNSITFSLTNGGAVVAISGTGVSASFTTVKFFTVGTGLPYVLGTSLRIERTSAPASRMTTSVVTYNSGTGGMFVTVSAATGTVGTYTDWTVLDQRNLTISDSSANSGVTQTTAFAMWVNGERITGSRTANVVSSVARNTANARSLPGWTIGAFAYHNYSSATSGAGPGLFCNRIDLGPSGTLDFNVCTLGYRMSVQTSDASSVSMRHVGISSYLSMVNSQGGVYFEDVIVGHAAQIASQASSALTSILGQITFKRFKEYSLAMSSAAANCVLTNCPSVTVDDIHLYAFDRSFNGVGVLRFNACGFPVTPKNIYCVGTRFTLIGCANFEVEKVYIAADPDGTTKVASSYSHIDIATCLSYVVREVRPIGTAKLSTAALISSDALSAGGIFHDIDFSANNNADSITSICAQAGNDYIFANITMGNTIAGFSNSMSRGTSASVEKDVVYRNVRGNTAGLLTTNNGIPYSTGLRVEAVACGQMRWVSAGGTVCPSYKDCATYYTLWDSPFTSGRLCVGAVSGEAASDLYDLTGTAYINNDGRVYLEGAGDAIVLKNRFAIRSVTALQNVAPTIRAVNGGALTYEFRACQWGEDVTAASWTTLDATNLSAFTIADSDVGFDMQIRITGAGVVSGRYFEQLHIITTNDSAFSPPPGETNIDSTGSEPGAESAIISYPRTLIDHAVVDAGGLGENEAPFYADGIDRDIVMRVRKYGFAQYMTTLTYYRNAISQAAPTPADANVTQPSGTAAAHTGITVTDHGGSPVTWNSKVYGITIEGNLTTNPTLTADDIRHFIHYHIAHFDLLAGYPGTTWHNMLPMDSTETERGFYGGSLYKGVRVVDQTGAPFPGFTRHQADDGSFYSAPVLSTGSITGILTGSKVRVYNVTEATTPYLGTPGTSYSVSYLDGSGYTTGDILNVRVHKRGYLTYEATVTVTASGWIVGAQQVVDDAYVANGFDGSVVTGYTADYVEDDVNVTLPVGFDIGEFYAWWSYNLESDDGLSEFVGGITALDAANIRINDSVVNIYLDNDQTEFLLQSDNRRIFRADGAYPCRLDGYGIGVNWRTPILIATTGGSALTPAESAHLLGLDTVNLDVAISTRMATDNATVATVGTQVDELHRIHGLKSGEPMTVTPTGRQSGTLEQTISGTPTTAITVTRV